MSYTNFEDYLNTHYKPYGCNDTPGYGSCHSNNCYAKDDCNPCYTNNNCAGLSKYLGCCCNTKYLIITVIVALCISRCLGPHQKHLYGYLLIIAGYTFLLMSAC